MYVPAIPFSGVAGLRFLDRTGEAQREALSKDSEVARETEYFKENIAKATSSEALLADRRLLQVALTAYGLESEIDKTAFIKQVLDEGTENSTSFANRLNDARWLEFAKAFGYGDARSGGETSNFRAAVELRFRPSKGARDDALTEADLQTFRANIDQIDSVDALLADESVMKVALAAYGLERGYYTDDHFRQLLSEGADGAYADGLDDGRWASFAAAFSGLADGEPATDVSQFQMAAEREMARRGVLAIASQEDADASPLRVSTADLTAFRAALDAAATPADALADDSFLAVTRAAYGLVDDSVDDAEARAILTAALSGDFEAADEQSAPGWRQAATALGASWPDGVKAEVSSTRYKIELEIAREGLEELAYLASDEEALPKVDPDDLAYFSEHADAVSDASELIADERLLDVTLRAFGLEKEGKSLAFIQSILEEDIYAKGAFAAQLSDTRWADLARAFQPPPDPSAGQPDLWRFGLEERLFALGAPEEDIDYLRDNWNLIDDSVDLTLDPKLMDIAVSAFGIEKNRYTTSFAFSAMISDLDNKNSFTNLLKDDRWTAFTRFFGQAERGNVGVEGFADQVLEKYEAHLFEIQVGTQDDSLRVALNFQRKIGEIANSAGVATSGWLKIMGDTPLRTVMDAAFNLPKETAQLDIDAQLPLYRARSQALFGGSEPDVFKNPLNVQKAIDLYIARSSGGLASTSYNASSNALSMLSQSVSFARSVNSTF